MIAVIATIETTPGNRGKLLEIFKELRPKVLAEKGCIEYAPMIDVETTLTGRPPREDVVTMIEKWESVAALAGPPSPLKPALPLPATVVMTPLGDTFRIL